MVDGVFDAFLVDARDEVVDPLVGVGEADGAAPNSTSRPSSATSPASAGTVDNANGAVVLPPGATGVTVTLATAPAFAAVGGLDLCGYCGSIGRIGGAVLDGTTAYDWKCVTSFGSHVAISMDDACAWPYRTTEGVFSQAATMTDPYSWQCYSS